MCLFLATFYKLNAQTFYVKNTTNNYDVDVTNILKYGVSCVGSSNCPMIDIIGIPPGGGSSQVYPVNCNAVPDIKLNFQIDPPLGPIITTSYCGTSLFNQTIIGYSEVYDIYPSGGGTSILLYIHY